MDPQNRLYRTSPEVQDVARRIIAANEFDTARRLSTYFNRTCPEFVECIASLGPDDHWMDAGSGESRAVCEYLGLIPAEINQYNDSKYWLSSLQSILDRAPEKRARATAISFTLNDADVRERLEKHSRANLLTGVYFEDLDIDREIVQRFGRVRCIVDYHGIMAYSENVSLVLEKYFSCLTDDGRIFIKVSAWTRELGLHQSVVKLRDGETLSLPDWLSRQQGISARFLANGAICELQRQRGSGIQIGSTSLASLTPGTPPIRTFVETATRYAFDVECALRIVGSDRTLLPCMLLDASARGAHLLVAEQAPAVGARVLVTLDSSFRDVAEAVVRWTRAVPDGHHVGVQFGFEQSSFVRALQERRK